MTSLTSKIHSYFPLLIPFLIQGQRNTGPTQLRSSNYKGVGYLPFPTPISYVHVDLFLSTCRLVAFFFIFFIFWRGGLVGRRDIHVISLTIFIFRSNSNHCQSCCYTKTSRFVHALEDLMICIGRSFLINHQCISMICRFQNLTIKVHRD